MKTKKRQLIAPLRIKASDIDSETGIFEGYGSIFGNVDSYNEVMIKGSFAKSLKEKGAKGIKMLWQHNANEPIGVYESMEEDEMGLKVRGRLLIDEIPKARECLALMKAGALEGLSIGFTYTEDGTVIGKDGITYLNEVDLWEVSPVTFPANTDALVTSVKTGNIENIKSKTDLEIFLKDAGFSKATAIQIAAQGFKEDMIDDEEKELTEEEKEALEEEEKAKAKADAESEDDTEDREMTEEEASDIAKILESMDVLKTQIEEHLSASKN